MAQRLRCNSAIALGLAGGILVSGCSRGELPAATSTPWSRPVSARYQVQVAGGNKPLLRDLESVAQELDRDGDLVLRPDELARRVEKAPSQLFVDSDDYTLALAHSMTGTPSPYAGDYPDSALIARTLTELAQKPDSPLTAVNLGSSAEGRPILAARVALSDGRRRPRILVVGQLHGREWIGHQVALSILRSLLDETANRDLLEDFEFWIVPLANPDGYEYSRSRDLSWRKNRRMQGPRGAYGVDLNRNFAADFRPALDTPETSQDDRGASDAPRNQDFRGRQPASEPEVKLLQQLFDGPEKVAGVVDLHGFGCLAVVPHSEHPELEPVYQRSVQAALEALGQDYRLLYIDDVYPVSGSLIQYADQRGAVGLSLEIGRAFQPHPGKLAEVNSTATRGVLAFARALRKTQP